MGHHREPVKHTCPDIDKLLRGVYEINKLIAEATRLDEVDGLKDLISEIESIIWDFDTMLDDLRKDNDSLREWGINEAEAVDDLTKGLEILLNKHS